MLFVIDSNEYIFAFGSLEKSKSLSFLHSLLDNPQLHTIRIPRTIYEEVKRNLTSAAFKEFNKFTNSLTTIEEDIIVTFEIAFKYEAKGLKSADAFIAAFTEWVGADALVTENRHFLIHHSDLPFKVVTAEDCLKLI
ncbi:MAG: hypothetical protein ACE5GV_10645 [Candidatus Scalindua sp.]